LQICQVVEYKTRPEVHVRDKHSSLFVHCISDGEKVFKNFKNLSNLFFSTRAGTNLAEIISKSKRSSLSYTPKKALTDCLIDWPTGD
jgi:hypothetical protein